MSFRTLTFSVLSAVFLALSGVVVFEEVNAQQACNEATQCAAGLRCVSGRCNAPPPVWDATGSNFPASGQLVGFDVARESRVRANLTVGEGFTIPTSAPAGSIIAAGDLFVNAIYSRPSSQTINDIWVGDSDDVVRIQGDLRVGPATRPQCGPGQILKRASDGARWECAEDIGGSAADACAVNIYRSVSGISTDGGSVGGYMNAHGRCPTGQHVCTAEEVLHTIACSRGRATALFPSTGSGWVNGGPPGDVATANDCNGWTSASGTDLGRVWNFDASGGRGILRNCDDNTLPFLCCQ